MGHILSYLLTYLLLPFPVGYPVPVVLPDGYPGNKLGLPGYGSPMHVTATARVLKQSE